MDRRDRTKNLVCEILCYSGPALKVHKKEKKAMKYMFASDIHGSAYYCKKMLEAYDKEKADRLVLLGDILYHGPRNDRRTMPQRKSLPCSMKEKMIYM